MRNIFKTVIIICMLCIFTLCNTIALASVDDEKNFPVKITFDQSGALYHVREAGKAFIQLNKPYKEVTVGLLDTDRKMLSRKSYIVKGDADMAVHYPLRQKELGYYTLKVIAESALKSDTIKEGFGIIPNVTLTKKDWDPPFGICGHYARYDYKKWNIATVQQKLGIAWVRDESNWERVVEENPDSDPDLDYLDCHRICWLNLFGYINSFDGIQNDRGVWTWNKGVPILKKYVELIKGHFAAFESRNEPNSFGGWSKR